jgi:hypothetical protein
LHQGASLNVGNYYRGIKVKKAEEPPIPFPFFTGQANPTDLNYRTKFTRRQACDYPITAEDLLQAHREQIKQRQLRQHEEKRRIYEEDIKRVNEANKEMVDDRHMRLDAEHKKRQIFIEANLSRIHERANQHAEADSEKRQETYDYFPFTHGDQIEKHQDELKKMLFVEMKAAGGPSQVKVSSEPVSVVTKMPMSHYTEYPVFLRLNENHPVRRIEDTHVTVTMQEALKRYEEHMVKLELEQERRDAEQRYQTEHNQQFFESQLQKRANQVDENRKYLEMQIQERESLKRLEKAQRRELVRTNFGPEETPEDFVEEEERKGRIKQEVREVLYTQMKHKFDKERTHKTQERAEDIENIVIAGEVIAQETEKERVKEKKKKELYREAWDRQVQMKELERSVEMVL